MAKNCVLCRAIKTGAHSQTPELHNTILGETEHFALMPAVGPIVLGHILIVSKEHSRSLASLSKKQTSEYEGIVSRLLTLPIINGNLLEAEHGADEEKQGGGCIVHTHVNLLPRLGECIAPFYDALTPMENAPTLQDVEGIKKPYVFLRGASRQSHIFDATSSPSQIIRQILCGVLEQVDWNWRLSPRSKLIASTVAFWKAALKDVHLA